MIAKPISHICTAISTRMAPSPRMTSQAASFYASQKPPTAKSHWYRPSKQGRERKLMGNPIPGTTVNYDHLRTITNYCHLPTNSAMQLPHCKVQNPEPPPATTTTSITLPSQQIWPPLLTHSPTKTTTFGAHSLNREPERISTRRV